MNSQLDRLQLSLTVNSRTFIFYSSAAAVRLSFYEQVRLSFGFGLLHNAKSNVRAVSACEEENESQGRRFEFAFEKLAHGIKRLAWATWHRNSS